MGNTVQTETGQPAPVVMNYDQQYKISDLFIEHLKESLRDMPHYKAVQYVEYAIKHKEGISLVDLNGFIKKLGLIEYGFVATLMANINNPEAQKRYFLPINKDAK